VAEAVAHPIDERSGIETRALFDELVREQSARAVAIAYHLVGSDRAAAEDVAQEAFLKAHAALGSFRGEAKLSTWFMRILIRQAASHRRRRWVRDKWSALWPGGRDPGGAVDERSPRPDAASDPGMRRRIAAALDTLPERQRVAFALVHLEGLTVNEAAQVIGCAPGTAKSHLHRALEKLRAQLADLWQEEESR
jgi:RNA polymerase sigma-70 factor (ECF subfamily)